MLSWEALESQSKHFALYLLQLTSSAGSQIFKKNKCKKVIENHSKQEPRVSKGGFLRSSIFNESLMKNIKILKNIKNIKNIRSRPEGAQGVLACAAYLYIYQFFLLLVYLLSLIVSVPWHPTGTPGVTTKSICSFFFFVSHVLFPVVLMCHSLF